MPRGLKPPSSKDMLKLGGYLVFCFDILLHMSVSNVWPFHLKANVGKCWLMAFGHFCSMVERQVYNFTRFHGSKVLTRLSVSGQGSKAFRLQEAKFGFQKSIIRAS